MDASSTSLLRRWLVPALLVIGAAALSLPKLGNAPLYVSHDEVVYSLQAHALASTGRDLSGRFLPMYIEYGAQFGRPTWDQPILIYAIAATLKVLPFSEFAIRLPMALLAILDVLLTYLIARVLFASDRFAIAAAILLALTPAHFMHGRLAIDFQLAVPFILGWLLAVVIYLRSDRPRVLFAAGLVLGVSLFGYVAAYLLVPIFALCTCAALLQRRDRLDRYVWFIAGIGAPALVCLPWMLRYPLPFRDVVAHYSVLTGQPSTRSGFIDLVKDFVGSSRLLELPSLYASFFDPEFLFIDGPLRFRATQLVGVFLVGIAGPLIVGIVQAARRRTTGDLLLLAGFFAGPFVASIGGEGQAIWRTLQMAPFGALLIAGGLRQMAASDTRAARAAIVVMFGVGIGLASWFHDFLPQAQALVRALTVPLAVTGLAMLLQTVDLERVTLVPTALVSGAVIASMHVAYFAANQATMAGAVLVAAIGLATLLSRSPALFSRQPLVAVALIALVTGQFMFLYVDYGVVPRVGPVPASALLLAMRVIVSSFACAIALIVARWSGRSGSATEVTSPRLLAFSSAALVAIQVAYYGIDLFADYRLRMLQVALVVAAVVGVAMLVRQRSGHFNIGHLAVAGLFGVAVLQFVAFYADYVTEFQARGSAEIEGNVRESFERAIAQARDRSVPAIYLGKIGPYAYGEFFWRFYVIKHHQEELLTRTIADGEFNPDRVRALPPGSIAITSPTRQIDSEIDALQATGVLKERQLMRAPDGAPIFWMMETAGR